MPLQLSARSHSLAAGRQTAVLFASAGQLALVPVQNSDRSQMPAGARHCVVLGLRVSAGQSLAIPSQLSATSQAPAAGRQTAVVLASGGQAALLPGQNSATSQTPAAARHSVVLGLKASAGQSFEVPS